MLKTNQILNKHRILIVDDQEINCDILGSILEKDYEIAYAHNGSEALDYIRRNFESLSLVMLDLIMPVMSGFEVLEIMRQDEELEKIPVIVLTSEKDAEVKALRMGAEDFITKPFDIHEVILARAARVIELSEGRRLISAAEYDKLTMLYTRNFFFEYVERLYEFHPDEHYDAVVINVEQFHSINAVNGREFGDKVLHTIGSIIRTFLSETKGIAGRFETDSFNIYCQRTEDYASLLKDFQKQLDDVFPNASVHIRMGVMLWQEDVTPLAMFDHAKTACGKVRGNHNSPLMVFNEEMRLREIMDRRLLNDLRGAIDNEQLVIYYQPKYDIQSNPPRLASAEALIRWKHPELGFIPPSAFIPLFEGNGLISVVDSFVWQNAAKQVAQWKEKYGLTLPVSVNVSRFDIFSLDLVEKFEEMVEQNGLNCSDLKLEITESAYTEDAEMLFEVINKLKELGFVIEMDDFGSGYSSLNMLSSMPVDVLKMDMKFIRNIEMSETDRRLVALIIDIAKHLNLTVVAEGVENYEQLEILKEAGCDLVQGYYFSHPVSAEEFEKMIIDELNTERK
jgi:diguanylate cyclase (GGDEF)-like protein